jgi:large subunit ribosomal protein L18
MSKNSIEKRNRIRYSIRKKIHGTAEKPRLAVFRSNKRLVAQIINDDLGTTLVAIATNDKILIDTKGTKSEIAQKAGEAIAQKAIEANVKEVVFDRGGYQYHGRVKAFAEGARKAGLKF